jgi:threonine dehydratase
LKKTDIVFIPVGGGGLASGIGGYFKSQNAAVEIIGCQPVHSPVMQASIRAGRIVEMESRATLSDGTSGGIEPGSITFDICRECVDDFVLITEEEIKKAIIIVLEKHHLLIEGAAALSVAAFLKMKKDYENKTVVLILTGKRIGIESLKCILCGGEPYESSDCQPG